MTFRITKNSKEHVIINAIGYLFKYDIINQQLSLLDCKDMFIVNTKSRYDILEGVTKGGIYKRYNKGVLEIKKDFFDEIIKTPIIPTELLAYDSIIYVPNRRFFVYELSKDISNYSVISTEPQASTTSSKGVYTANYTDATVWFYPYNVLNNDNLKHINLENKDDYMIGKIQENQMRPYMMDINADEDMIAIVTGPQYGEFGGAVSFFDINKQELIYTKRNAVKNHTLMSVCFDHNNDNYVYIGTYANGENTSIELNEDAHIVKWDINSKNAIFDVILEPGVWKAIDVVSSENGLYAVSSAAHLFKLNPTTGEIINKNFKDEIIDIVIDNKGDLYGISRSSLYLINKDNLFAEVIKDGFKSLDKLTLDKKSGNLYFFDNTNLIEYKIK